MHYSSEYKISRNTLSNGLDLLNVDNIHSEFVTILLLVKTGSRDEEEEFSGISHALEHMFFKGSANFPTSIKLAMEIELLGGITNAFTSYEYTGYYIKVPKGNAKKALSVFADLMQNPVFREGELEKEKGVILEEIRMYEDVPYEKVRDEFNKHLFGGHPLGRDIAGTKESLSNIEVKDLEKYLNENYRLGNMLLVIGGDYGEGLIEDIENSFGKMRSGKKKNFERYTNTFEGKHYIPIFRQSEQTHIVIGGLAHEYNHPNEYPFKMGMYILAQGFGSKLFQSLREDLGIAYYCTGGVANYSDTGKYFITAGLSNEKLADGLDAILKNIEKIITGDFSKKDLERAKNYCKSSILENFETVEDQSTWFGLNTLQGKDLQDPLTLIEKIESITSTEIKKSWESAIHSKGQLLCMLGPKSNINHGRIGEIFN